MKLNLILAILLLCSVVSYANFLKKILKKRSIDDNLFENSDKMSINENGIIDSMDDLSVQRIFEDKQECGGTNSYNNGYYGYNGSDENL